MEIRELDDFKLLLEVVNMSDFGELYASGIMPLGIVTEDVKDIDEVISEILETFYFKSCLYDTTYLPDILALDLSAIDEWLGSTQHTITHVIHENDEVHKVERISNTCSTEIPTRIRIVKRKGIFKKERVTMDLHDLVSKAIIRKVVELRRYNPLTPEQIEEIHEKNQLTPAEKVREWESIGLCAPGNHMGSAANRCRVYDECHECLLDYAYTHHAHDKLEKDLKIVNSVLDREKMLQKK